MQENHEFQIRNQIEQSLGWGDSTSWTTQDFEELSDRIHEKTGRMISATTLKRIWGRVAYESKPSRHSLDTLARFLEYPSWRTFTQAVEPAQQVSNQRSLEFKHQQRKVSNKSTFVFGFFMLIIGAGIVLWLGSRNVPGDVQIFPETENILFKSRPLAQGLPNTVVFDYDLSGIRADSFFIQQSWDPTRRVRISPDKRNHAAIYYYPGYFDAKLVANNTILKEHPVHVKTEGWMAIVRKDSFPVYVPATAMEADGILAVQSAWLRSNGFDVEKAPYDLRYYNVRNFGSLYVDNFSMDAVVKHTEKFAAPCQGGQVLIRARYGIVRFPFNTPGCVGTMHVTAGDVFQRSEEHDMSALGADYNNWQAVKLIVQDGNVRIKIGTNPFYSLSYSNTLGELVGIWFLFDGIGAVDLVKLYDDQERLIYEDAF